jgi:hypothetical protein
MIGFFNDDVNAVHETTGTTSRERVAPWLMLVVVEF